MKQDIIDLFRAEGVSEQEGIALLDEAKIVMHDVTRKECRALEIAHRVKLIESGASCAKCFREDMLTTDHVIPKVILADFGIDVERTYMPNNLILLCRPCNTLKSNHLDFSLPATKQILLELINQL